MKFGEVFDDYLHGEQEEFLNKCSHVEYKRLKKVLKRCRICGKNGENDSCPFCDEAFFDELMKEANEVSGYFTSKARRLIHRHDAISLSKYGWCFNLCFANKQKMFFKEGKKLLDYATINAIAVRKILKKYDKIHCSMNGRNFKKGLIEQQIEPLQSPWLIELGALCMNFKGTNVHGSGMFFQQLSCDLTEDQPTIKLIVSDSIEIDYSLTCAICLDTVFRPQALGCGHLFCKGCACSAASLFYFEDLKSASPATKCPICRAGGVYSGSFHMVELDFLLKKRCPEYWKERRSAERVELLKQTREYWNMQTTYMIGYH